LHSEEIHTPLPILSLGQKFESFLFAWIANPQLPRYFLNQQESSSHLRSGSTKVSATEEMPAFDARMLGHIYKKNHLPGQ
jgi:hypothetical protein